MNILITGGTGGIGQAIARIFAGSENTLGIHYNSAEKKACDFSDELKSAGTKVELFQADLEKEDGRAKLCCEISERFSVCDVLINNAGGSNYAVPIGEYSEENANAIMGLNFYAPLFLSQKVLPGMLKRGSGNIINISSIGVKFGGGEKTAVYAAAKSALETLTLNLAKKHASENIRINCVRVGVTDTDFHKKIPKDMESRKQLIPMQRFASPDEIAEMVYFLANEKSSYITGQIFSVSGGE